MLIDLFSEGKIYLIKTPVNGNAGIPSLFSRIINGSFGITFENSEESYFLFCTANKKTLIILHVDEAGIDITKRRLFGGKFKIIFEDTANPIKLTRDQLKRMVLDGTAEGEWQSLYQKVKQSSHSASNVT